VGITFWGSAPEPKKWNAGALGGGEAEVVEMGVARACARALEARRDLARMRARCDLAMVIRVMDDIGAVKAIVVRYVDVAICIMNDQGAKACCVDSEL